MMKQQRQSVQLHHHHHSAAAARHRGDEEERHDSCQIAANEEGARRLHGHQFLIFGMLGYLGY